MNYSMSDDEEHVETFREETTDEECSDSVTTEAGACCFDQAIDLDAVAFGDAAPLEIARLRLENEQLRAELQQHLDDKASRKRVCPENHGRENPTTHEGECPLQTVKGLLSPSALTRELSALVIFKTLRPGMGLRLDPAKITAAVVEFIDAGALLNLMHMMLCDDDIPSNYVTCEAATRVLLEELPRAGALIDRLNLLGSGICKVFAHAHRTSRNYDTRQLAAMGIRALTVEVLSRDDTDEDVRAAAARAHLQLLV